MVPIRAMRTPMGNAVLRGVLHHWSLSGGAVACAALIALGCQGRGRGQSETETAGSRSARAPGPAAHDAQAASPAAGGKPAEPARGGARRVAIPWISDDYAAAVARARSEKKPLFIDMWAPWCHTCLSMKQVVMVDPSLG